MGRWAIRRFSVPSFLLIVSAITAPYSFAGYIPAFELWWIQPEIQLPPSKGTQAIGRLRFRRGTFGVGADNVVENFSFSNFSVVGGKVVLGEIESRTSTTSLKLLGKGSLFHPKIPFTNAVPPQNVILMQTGKVDFVVKNKESIELPFPDVLELDVGSNGELSLVDPDKLIAHFDNEIKKVFSPTYFRKTFKYWFVGLGSVTNALSEHVVDHFMDRILAQIRGELSARVQDPLWLQTIVNELSRKLPVSPTDDFTGLRLRFETWRLPDGIRYGWRMRPASPSRSFSKETFAQYWSHLSGLKNNSVSLFLHQDAVSYFTSLYLRRLYRGDSNIAILPVSVSRHPDFPWLQFKVTESEAKGIALYFMDHVKGLRFLEPYGLSMVAEGDGTPDLLFWKQVTAAKAEMDYIDLKATFILSNETENYLAPVSVRLQLDQEGLVRVERITPESKDARARPAFLQMGSALKEAVFKHLLSAQLNGGIKQVRKASQSLFSLKRVHHFGSLPNERLEVPGVAAEAICADFDLNRALRF